MGTVQSPSRYFLRATTPIESVLALARSINPVRGVAVMSKPIEEYPRKLIPLDYWPPPGIQHPVKTGERWESIAAQYGVDVKVLIHHNFKTTRPNEINWYLRHLIGCNVSTDGLNWAFTSGLKPGYIVVPATTINMEPEVITAPEGEIKRLKPIVKDIPGLVGERIRCLL